MDFLAGHGFSYTHNRGSMEGRGGLDGEEYNAIKKCISTTSITSYLATRLASIYLIQLKKWVATQSQLFHENN